MTEGGMMDAHRRGGEVMGAMKIFDYLMSHKLHTKISLFYFARRFLLYQYYSSKIEEIGEILKANSQFSHFDYLRFTIAIKIHWIFRKFTLIILNINR